MATNHDAGSAKGLLLAIDVGNTQTVLGLYEGQTLIEHWRLATNPRMTTDELGVQYRAFFATSDLDYHLVERAIVSSVVPPIDHAVRRACRRYFDVEARFVTPDSDLPIQTDYDNPMEIGPDRLVNAISAFEHFQGAAMVIDFGTATTIDVINNDAVYMGGVIAPGIRSSLDALISKAAMLTKIEIKKPDDVMGKNTTTALQSGTIYGYVGLVDGLCKRIFESYPELHFRVVATGGMAGLIHEDSKYIEKVDPFLTLDGLRILDERWSR